MTIFQNSTGRWVYHDGSTYQYFYTQEAAQMAASTSMIGETPAEVKIAATVTGEILPQLRSALLALSALKMAWYANEILAAIDAALEAQAERASAVWFLRSGAGCALDVLSTGVVRFSVAVNAGQSGSIECMYKL